MVEMKITGLKELQVALEGMPGKLGGEILSSALGSAATVIQNDAKSRVLIAAKAYWLYTGNKSVGLAYPGWLRDQIIKKRTIATQTQAQTIITVKGKGRVDQAFFWRFIEYGHFTRGKKAGETRKFKRGEHPMRWVPAHPFMRPALSSQSNAALQKFIEKMRMKIDKENGK